MITAIKWSCNIFFYDVGRRLTSEVYDAYAYKLGLGVRTGVEVSEALGHLTSKTDSNYMESLDVQAAIGQGNTVVSPVQLATYAATIATITTREYVTREGKAFKPTELGEVITKLMKERFPKIVNVKFTAQVENELDAVQRGDEDWVDTLQKFYDDFDKTVQKAKKEMDGVKIQLKEDETDVICEKCGRRMVVKVGRYGKFLACPGYPECKNVKKIVNDTGAECPKCGGKIIQRKSKKGRVFYGCSEYPKCDFVSWDPPSKEKCPVCGKTLMQKKSKDKTLYCVTPDCTFPGKKPDEDEG